ncbi:hypothetical protein [Paraburkholderia azotifigens]|uniref:Uncharacterized protein n=1 Tax=Paraburkholderia azotifigens TaxID=2057004 RepID=A0A5C6VI04_9BURK|nr:hypothetical protein [Paraburkholderia azotifigens]TXC83395.1 hypothetical protein FRZ40_23635 [Paraburkholderia azotifigens]
MSATQSPLFDFSVFSFFGFWFLLRWHPRIRIGASRVAPVRGGTYFLCRRKESKGISAKVLALT